MDALSVQLNELLVETFQGILKMEERSLKEPEGWDLSISEIHLLEAMEQDGDGGATISELAAAMEITLPSVTVAVNRLEQKGYALKVKSPADGRRVYALTTRQGHKLVQAHRYFHQNMVRNMIGDLTEEEKQVMLKGVTKLNAFFRSKIVKK